MTDKRLTPDAYFQRGLNILRQRRSGMKYREIGEVHTIGRERVRQILSKMMRIENSATIYKALPCLIKSTEMLCEMDEYERKIFIDSLGDVGQ